MGTWVTVDDHQVQVTDAGVLLWEHPCKQPYPVDRHLVGKHDGVAWQVVSRDPLTLSPSLHCDPSLGGCGRHGCVTAGHWVGD